MDFSGRLDSIGNETKFELFTKPLRGVLGGRHFTDRNKLISNEDSSILRVWQRFLVGIILIAAFPYTIIAGAFVAFSEPKDIIKMISKQALSPIFNGAKIELENIPWGDPSNIEQFDEPCWIAVVRTGDILMHSLVIPLDAKDGTKTHLDIDKDVNQSGEHAFWSCHLNKVGGVAVLPLFPQPDANTEAIQPIKDLLAGRSAIIKGIEYKLREKTVQV